MTPEEAKQWIDSIRQPDGELYLEEQEEPEGWPMVWHTKPGDEQIRLDGWFTPAQLRALADYIESSPTSPTPE